MRVKEGLKIRSELGVLVSCVCASGVHDR
jgi:hypothetical protein